MHVAWGSSPLREKGTKVKEKIKITTNSARQERPRVILLFPSPRRPGEVRLIVTAV